MKSGIRGLGGLIVLLGQWGGMAAAQPPPTEPAANSLGALLPAWTTDAKWYYINVPRYRNGDKANDPNDVLPWSTIWPPLETNENAPRDASGEYIRPKMRRYGGDLRGVIDDLPRLKRLGVNALLISPVFHGAAELKVAQVDLRHVDDSIGVKGGFAEADKEGAKPDSWIWTSSDQVMRELIHSAHERGIRVVMGGIFYAVMSANSPPSELEAYYIGATRRWMDPDGDGKPIDGVDGWFLSLEEGPTRQFDEKMKAFWSRWRKTVRELNPNAVVISSGTLALSQLADGLHDIALSTSVAPPLIDLLGNQPGRKKSGAALFESVTASSRIVPPATINCNINMTGGGDLARLLSELATTEPLRTGRVRSPGPEPDEAARQRWKVATILQHFMPGTPVTWYGDEAGMFGGPGEYSDAPMWLSEGVAESARSPHFQIEFFSLVQWLHQLRDSYPILRSGGFRKVLADDSNKVLAFSRFLGEEEIVLVVNYGDTKQQVMVPAGKAGELVGVRSPHLKPPRSPRKTADPRPADSQSLSVAGARQFVGEEGKVRVWLDPMSVRLIFVEKSK